MNNKENSEDTSVCKDDIIFLKDGNENLYEKESVTHVTRVSDSVMDKIFTKTRAKIVIMPS